MRPICYLDLESQFSEYSLSKPYFSCCEWDAGETKKEGTRVFLPNENLAKREEEIPPCPCHPTPHSERGSHVVRPNPSPRTTSPPTLPAIKKANRDCKYCSLIYGKRFRAFSLSLKQVTCRRSFRLSLPPPWYIPNQIKKSSRLLRLPPSFSPGAKREKPTREKEKNFLVGISTNE